MGMYVTSPLMARGGGCVTCAKPRLKKPARTLLWVLLDVLLVNAALFLAQVVRYSSNISYSFFENSISGTHFLV